MGGKRMSATQILFFVLLVIAGVAGCWYIVHLQNKHTEQGHTPVTPKSGTGDALRDTTARTAFVRKLKVSAWKRGLRFVALDAASPLCGLLIGPSGVTGVFADDHSGTIYGSDEPVWAQIDKGGVRRTFESPIVAAEKARKTLRDVINTGKFRPFNITARVVMVSPKAELAIPKSLPVATVKDFLHDVENSAEFMQDRHVDEDALEHFLQENLSNNPVNKSAN
jgi:hypothetical protein